MFLPNYFLIRQPQNNLLLMLNYFSRLRKNNKKKNLKTIIQMKTIINKIYQKQKKFPKQILQKKDNN